MKLEMATTSDRQNLMADHASPRGGAVSFVDPGSLMKIKNLQIVNGCQTATALAHAARDGTLKTDTITFGLMVLVVIVLVAALSFFPVLTLGPIAEYYSISK